MGCWANRTDLSATYVRAVSVGSKTQVGGHMCHAERLLEGAQEGLLDREVSYLDTQVFDKVLLLQSNLLESLQHIYTCGSFEHKCRLA